MTSQDKTLIDQTEEDEVERIELAAARASVQALDLLHSAIDESGMKQKDVAAALRVTEGRVSQVLGGDGNIRITTLARVLRASGYRLQLGAQPTGHEARALPLQRRRHDAVREDRIFVTPGRVTTFESGAVGQRPVVVLSEADPKSYVDSPRIDWREARGSDQSNDLRHRSKHIAVTV